MRIKLIIAGLLISTAAIAQQPQPPIEFNLKVNATEVELIGKALGMLPFNDVAGLIQKLRTQVIEQQNPKPDAKNIPDPKK